MFTQGGIQLLGYRQNDMNDIQAAVLDEFFSSGIPEMHSKALTF
jgi:hypothetical protein